MSDYFGALLRSSGVVLGLGAREAVATGALAASVGIEAEAAPDARPQAATPQEHPVVATSRETRAPIDEPTQQRVARTHDEQARVSPLHAVRPQARVAPDADTSKSARSGEPVDPVLQAPREPERDAPSSGPPVREALVRAAMRWVAADPQASLQPVDAAAGLSAPPVIVQESSVVRRAPRPGPAVEQKTQSSPPAEAHAPVRTFDGPRAVPSRSTAEATRVPAIAAPTVRDEHVEISIGAIHVRVDAPASQTLARVPVSPPPTTRSPSASPGPVRSGLARRALRRI
jgi:hypothetical protein